MSETCFLSAAFGVLFSSIAFAQIVPPAGAPAQRVSESTSQPTVDPAASEAAEKLIRLLMDSPDRKARLSAAKALGDLSLRGELRLTENQDDSLSRVVSSAMESIGDKDQKKREEARMLLQGLWQLSAPGLLVHVDDKDMTRFDEASKLLSLMRNEEIIESLLARAKDAKGNTKLATVVVLGMMTEQRASLIPNRTCLGPKESLELANRLIVPYLQELQKDTDAQVKTVASQALKNLEEAPVRGVAVPVTRPSKAKP
ncbi:MAG TPA: hypothetical protein VIL86_02370 [Tepidisphaeraceae bacterium]